MIFAAGVVTLLVGAMPPQTAPADQPQKNGTVTLDGCVTASQTAKNAFTLDDDGRTYVLKGVNVRDFVGKHVEVIGALPKRLSIVGGLYPRRMSRVRLAPSIRGRRQSRHKAVPHHKPQGRRSNSP